MEALFFDSGPIISLVMSRLDFILPKLKEKFEGEFYITPSVKRELVDRPMNIRRFEFEALQVLKLIREGVLKVYDNIPLNEVKSLTKIANSSFKIRDKEMDIMQQGEMESVVIAMKTNSTLVIDERTLRLFIENSKGMGRLLERRFKKNVQPNKINIDEFSKLTKNVKIIRSVELAGVAFKLGLLNDYIPPKKGGKGVLLDGILWATKYNGCSVTEHEIDEIKNMLLK